MQDLGSNGTYELAGDRHTYDISNNDIDQSITKSMTKMLNGAIREGNLDP